MKYLIMSFIVMYVCVRQLAFALMYIECKKKTKYLVLKVTTDVDY